MNPRDTTRPDRPGSPRATAPPTRAPVPQGPTLGALIDAYLQDYQVRQFRSLGTARGRVAHLAAYFGRDARAAALTTYQMRQYQRARRAAGAATGTINRETSALHRMLTLAVHWGWLATVPGFPDRLRENPPRQGFFEHPEYLAVRAQLPAPWQDVLDVAYYSGWRKHEILFLTWEEIDGAGGVIRLSPARSKTRVGRILPLSPPIAKALARRRARRDPHSPLVFHRDGIPIRRWRTAWRTACTAAGVPTRFLHDCRRTAARNLIRAGVPERVAMLLTGHKTRAIFDRYHIVNEQELLAAGDQLAAYLAQPARRHAAPLRAPSGLPPRPQPLTASAWTCLILLSPKGCPRNSWGGGAGNTRVRGTVRPSADDGTACLSRHHVRTLAAKIERHMALVNWAARHGYSRQLKRIEDMSESSIVGVYDPAERPSAGNQTVSASSNRQPRLPSRPHRSRGLHRRRLIPPPPWNSGFSLWGYPFNRTS